MGQPRPGAARRLTGPYGPDRIVQTTYDDVSRPLTTTSALGTGAALTESVGYTANGRVGSLTDGQGNVSVMEYDGFDRLAKLRYPNATGGGTSTTDYEQYAFDLYGRPYSSRDRAGNLTYFGFDGLNRLVAVNYPSGTPDVSSGYDNLGRMSRFNAAGFPISAQQAHPGNPRGGAASIVSSSSRQARLSLVS